MRTRTTTSRASRTSSRPAPRDPGLDRRMDAIPLRGTDQGPVNAESLLRPIANDKKYFLSENTPYFSAVVAIPNQTRAPFTDPRSLKALHLLTRGTSSPTSRTRDVARWPSASARCTAAGCCRRTQSRSCRAPPEGSKERDEDIKNAMALLSAMGYSKSKPMTFEPLMATTASGYGAGRLLGEYWAAMWERESDGRRQADGEPGGLRGHEDAGDPGPVRDDRLALHDRPRTRTTSSRRCTTAPAAATTGSTRPVLDDMIVKQRAIFKSPEERTRGEQDPRVPGDGGQPGPDPDSARSRACTRGRRR